MIRGIVKIGWLFFGVPLLWYYHPAPSFTAHQTEFAGICKNVQQSAFRHWQPLLSPYATCTEVTQGSQSPKEVSVGSCTYVVVQHSVHSTRISTAHSNPENWLLRYEKYWDVSSSMLKKITTHISATCPFKS